MIPHSGRQVSYDSGIPTDDEPWGSLERHPDGTPKLVFEDYAAQYPDQYGEIDMPKTPPSHAPLPGHEPTVVAAPVLDPPQYGDGPAFNLSGPGRAQPSFPQEGKLVTNPVPGSVALDPSTVFAADPDSVSFVVVQSDVWQEVYTPGTSTPSYLLKWARGSRVPAASVAGIKALVSEHAVFPIETKSVD